EALGSLHARGVDVDWTGFFGGGGSRIDLPTYPFQRRRFWVDSTVGAAGPTGLGQADVGHPLLGAVVAMPDSGGLICTGRLSLDTHPWLADHEILGAVVVPGAALIELVLAAAGEAGCATVEELTLHAPLLLPPTGGVAVQVVVGGDTGTGRTVRVHSRTDDDWTLHAEGVVTGEQPEPDVAGMEWPPAGATPVDVDYAELARNGYGYGPAFQGVRAAYRRGDEFFAEVSLPDAGDAERFGVHPALLDAVLHASITVDGPMRLPFAWSGVRLHATNATALRARISPAGSDAITLTAVDPAGAPVLTVERLATREVSRDQLATGAYHDSLYQLEWIAVPAGRAPAPDAVLHRVPAGLDVRAAVHETLGVLQKWLAESEFGTLVVATEGAVALPGEGVTDLAGAAVWGLVRSVQVEHP
ncbi:polyketide synthase dehydratase domain-containing protein, partial [Actinoplanes sp. NPDC049802]|uniref:polyketide synthase dehydratase domain-containing protein n=1 Tax=Actinoplanes sp. NPDC049802 TaxID=3154742 RepID=UPI0033C616DF